MENGTYTNSELVSSLIVDLNNMIKNFISGQYLAACGIANSMGQKLFNLRSGIESDLRAKDNVIEQLKAQLREAGMKIEDMSAQEFVQRLQEKNDSEKQA